MKFKYVAIFLVILCCLMGAASATEDTSADVVDASADDDVVVNAVSQEMKTKFQTWKNNPEWKIKSRLKKILSNLKKYLEIKSKTTINNQIAIKLKYFIYL